MTALRHALPLVLLCMLGSAVADTSPRERAKQQLAIRAAAREVLDSLAGLATTNATDLPVLVEDLRRMMTTHIEHHETTEESRTASRVRLKHARLRAIDDLLNQAATRAHEQSPLPVTRADILGRLGPQWKTRKDEVMDRFLDQALDPLFRDARSRAVNAQKSRLEQSVTYPSFPDLDPRLTELAPTPAKAATPLSPQAFRTFRPWIQDIAFTNIVVFEENQPVIRRLGDDVLSEIQRQYDHQIRAVREPVASNQVPSECILEPSIAEVLLSSLEQGVANIPSNPPAPVYPPFTAVTNHAVHLARSLRDQRLTGFLEQPETIVVETARLRKALESTPENHRTPSQSHELLMELLVAELHRPLAERYAAGSRIPAVNQIDLLLMDDPAISKVFRKRIAEQLKQKLPPLRKDLAQNQFETAFPALATSTPIPDTVIEFLHDIQTPHIDNMGLLREVLALEESLAPAPHEPNALLVETEKLALEAANAMIEPLVRALGAQLRLLADIAEENSAQLRQDVIDGKAYEEIRAAWQTELEGRWKQSNPDVPDRARDLFPRTLDELDKTVRHLYDTIRTELAFPEKAETTADGEQTATPETEQVEVPEEPLEEEEDKEEEIQEKLAGMEEELLACRGMADFVFVLSDGPDDLGLVVFGHPARGMTTQTRFEPADVEAAAEKIASAVGENFTTVLEARAESARGPRILFWRDRTPLLRVLVLEGSRRMRHLSSILLQQKVKRRIEDWAKSRNLRFRLDWQETPGEDPRGEQ